MPYFVYQIDAEKTLTYVDEFDDFISARELCRSQRKEGAIPDGGTIRLIFAKNKKEAKSLLKEKRKPSTPVEEWEV